MSGGALGRRGWFRVLGGLPLAVAGCAPLPTPDPPPGPPLGLRALVLPTPAAAMNPQFGNANVGGSEINRLVAGLTMDPAREALALGFATAGVPAAERLRRHLVARLGAAGVAVRETAVRRPEPAPLREPPAAGGPVLDAVLQAFGYDVIGNAWRPRALLRLRVTGADGAMLLEEWIGANYGRPPPFGSGPRWRVVAGPLEPEFRGLPALRDGMEQAVAGLDAAIAAVAAEAALRVGPA